jgi:uncharacterized cupredoxin-like copper-binding protein
MFSRDSTASRRRRRSALARVFIVLGLAVLVLGFSYAGVGAPAATRVATFSSNLPPGGGGGTVNYTVNLTDTPSFAPHSLSAPPNSAVHLRLVNTGALAHSFTLSSTPNYVLPTSWDPTQLDAFFTANGSMSNVSVPAGTAVYDNFSLPTSALSGQSFEFVSQIAYQFQAGMHGFLNVSAVATGPGVVLNVAATDAFRFVPDVLAVNATSYPVTVDVDATNDGVLPHTWTLEGQPNYTLLASNYTSYFSAHPPLGLALLNNGGQSNWTNFTVLGPGIYEYICEVTGHFLNGMFGFLYVGVPPPANVTPPSTAIVQEGILVGAASLLGVGAIFAVAASYTGRFPRSPPSGGHGT